MRDIPETREAPEKQITKTPEKRINTYDDLEASDNAGKIKTYDDVRMPSNEKSIDTYDDMRADGERKNKTVSASDSLKTDGHEIVEQRRIDQAAETIRNQERMKPDNWKTLSIDERRQALAECNKELAKAYNTPEPPLETKKMEDTGLQGEYGDGYKYDASKDKYNGQIEVNPRDYEGHGIVGSDYGITMNERGYDPGRDKKLFGDDPRQAVETNGHEFRHSYQHEQALNYEKGFKVDNPEQAKEWFENYKNDNYKRPPDTELAKNDPEKYYKQYEAYWNQPVERDARDFGSKLSQSIYGDSEGNNGYNK